MSGPFLGQIIFYIIFFTIVFALKAATLGSMDTLELHRDILQPGWQLETPGLVGNNSSCQVLSI